MTRTQCGTRLLIPFMVLLSLGGCSAREQVLGVGQPGPALTCAQAVLPPDTQLVGPEGAELRTGNNELIIPANAVSDPQQVVFRRLPGDTVVVEVDSNIRFENNRSAKLVIDLSGCSAGALSGREWFVWRIHPTARSQSQKLHTKVSGLETRTMEAARATTRIDSTSVYMIAN